MGRRARRLGTSFVVVVFALAGVVSSSARAQVPPEAGGFHSPNVEWLKTIPVSGGGQLPGPMVPVATGDWLGDQVKIVGQFMYLNYDGVQIYDVSDPINPSLVGFVPRPAPQYLDQGQIGAFAFEGRFETNGKILMLPGWDREKVAVPGGDPRDYSSLYVYDIRDKSSPKEIAKLDFNGEHLAFATTCVLRCRWLYSRTGSVIDMRDPRRPRFVGHWNDRLNFHGTAYSTGPAVKSMRELQPGILLLGTNPMALLDARRNPLSPRVIAQTDGSPFSGGEVDWPDFPRGTVVLSDNFGTNDGGASRYGRHNCDEHPEWEGTDKDSVFAAWDASDWRRTGFLVRSGEYHLQNGTWTDGDPPAADSSPLTSSALAGGGGCQFMRFSAHPESHQGSVLVAAGAAQHGLKFLRVGGGGGIELDGWFLGHQANVFNAIWLTDQIVYSIDGRRGIDILRYISDL